MGSALSLHPKTAGGGLAGAVGLIVVYVLGRFNVTVTPDVAGAIVVVLGGLGSYFAPILGHEQGKLDGGTPAA